MDHRDQPYTSHASSKRQPVEDIESQFSRSDSFSLDDLGDEANGHAPESPSTSHLPRWNPDTLFTIVPAEDPDEILNNDHEPVLQPRGARTKTLEEQYQEAARRAAEAGPRNNEVRLFNGNLVLDCPVPPRLLDQIPHAQPPERDEFTHTRYSAVTCDPSDFYRQKYTLRPRLFGKPRHTELLITVTMYNENELELGRTLRSVMENVEYLCSRTNSKTWGKEAWKKIVICIIGDGRSKVNPKSLALLASLGVFQEGVAKSHVNGESVVAHLYEYTTHCGIEVENDRLKLKPRGQVPCQIVFCLKERNQRRVNSHRWLFQAFSDVLDPNICILFDVSTVPFRYAFNYLWSAFDRDPVCCSAIGQYKTNSKSSLFNPLVAVQHFEYKSKSMLDRPLDSVFGNRFDSGGGALAAYRYVALRNDREGNGPLQKYFLNDTSMPGAIQRNEILSTNMALAEDRLLSFELVNKKNSFWKVSYVAPADAEVDVPETLPEYLLQRRRWINGNAFSSIYSLLNFSRVLHNSHSLFRKMALSLQFIYHAFSLCLAWFSISLFYLTFRIITVSLSDQHLYGKPASVLAQFFGTLYLLNLLFGFILGLGIAPSKAGRYYTGVSHIWTILMIYFTFAIIVIITKVSGTASSNVAHLFDIQLFWSLVIPILVTYAIWLIVSLLFLSPWHMFTSLIQYILFLPTSINLVSVYAFCNIHDVSWGTLGNTPPLQSLPAVAQLGVQGTRVRIPVSNADLNQDYDAQVALLSGIRAETQPRRTDAAADLQRHYMSTRTLIVFAWVTSNVILATTILNIPSTNMIRFGDALEATQGSVVFIAFVFWRFAADAMFKAAGVVLYLLLAMFRRI